MARPERKTVDYFPFICEEGKKMYYIEETYGNDGFATFVKLLRELAKTENHYLDLSKPTTLMFLSAKCKVPKQTLESIINDLVDLGKFDRVLWTENSIIWCQDFIDSIQDAYFKRKNNCITYEGLLLLLQGLGVRKPIKRPLKAPDNPQSIVEDTKENNTTINRNDGFKNQCLKDEIWKETFYMQRLLKPDTIEFALKDFNTHLIQSGDEFKLDIGKYKYHFASWVKKRKEMVKTQTENSGKL